MDIEAHIENVTSENEEDSESKNENKRQTEERSTPSTRSRTRQALAPTRYAAIYTSEDTESEYETENEPKATNLFTENDVEGKLIYGFKTTKKRNGMVNKALGVTPSKDLNITKLTGTPVKSLKVKDMSLDPKTPHAVRKRIRKELASLAHKSDNSGGDFSDSGSDYNPDEPQSSSSSEDVSNVEEKDDSSGSSDKEMEITSKVRKLNIRPIKQSTVSKRGRPRKDTNYVLQSDNYFSTHATSKVVTSDHTLDKLKNPRLSQDKIQQLLKTMKLSETHEKSLKDLFEEYRKQFPQWMFILQEGFSILLHGLGSKRNILNTFHQEVLTEENVVIINGFFPSLTLKDILDSIMYVLDLNVNSTNVHEVVDLIEEELCQKQEEDLYLIIHNIDGPMLRNNKTQNVLARLAKMERIHLLTSIDHINAPLLWDHTKLSSFNFCWFDATSLLPYTYETSFEGSLLVHNSGALALSSLKNVFESLTSNSRGIYLLIVKNQIANKDNQNYQGMAFKDLYWSCRESFLVSSDLALRAQLTEFLDHKLVKMKRTMDGIEHLQIPIDNSLLQQFIDQQSK